jgi:hypothetical protein
MKKLFFIILTCAVFLVTNPSMEDHKQEVFNLVRTAAIQSDADAGLWTNLGVGIIEALDILPFVYSNYYFFSILSLEEEIVSIGLLGAVFVIPKEKIRDYFDK